jgi:hypothetical protein
MLPRGYLDMGREDYEKLSAGQCREIFAKVREIVRYFVSSEDIDCAVLPCKPITPADWLIAMRRVTCRCERCRGTGTYSWGACINGVMSHSAPCARCAGKGRMDFDDMRRSKAYDAYAIARACRA